MKKRFGKLEMGGGQKPPEEPKPSTARRFLRKLEIFGHESKQAPPAAEPEALTLEVTKAAAPAQAVPQFRKTARIPPERLKEAQKQLDRLAEKTARAHKEPMQKTLYDERLAQAKNLPEREKARLVEKAQRELEIAAAEERVSRARTRTIVMGIGGVVAVLFFVFGGFGREIRSGSMAVEVVFGLIALVLAYMGYGRNNRGL